MEEGEGGMKKRRRRKKVNNSEMERVMVMILYELTIRETCKRRLLPTEEESPQ